MFIDALVRDNIRKLKPYSSARDEFKGSASVFLDANENPYGTLNRYPDPRQLALKQRLAELKGLKPSQIFVGNGSDELIDLLFRIFCEPGWDKALSFSPSYGMYEVSADINDVKLLKLPLNADLAFEPADLEPYLEDKRLKLIFACSPNNPGGNHLPHLPWLLAHFEGIVVVDEAYIDFSSQPSMLRHLDLYPNLVISQTLSKAWGLAGARVGLGYASEAIITYLNKVKPPYNVSQLNQEAALGVLEDVAGFEQRLAEIKQEKARLAELLPKLPGVKRLYPSEANFFLVEVEDANAYYQHLAERGVIVRNRHSQVPNCLRLTVGSPEETRALIEAWPNMA